MNLRLDASDSARAITLSHDGGLLLRYVVASDAPANESPRPYVHPLHSLAGDPLTNFRPNDHPWHHALSLCVNSADGANFWGGPTHRAADGYRWRDDHGAQHHLAWTRLACDGPRAELAHTLEWRARGETFLHEERSLSVEVNSAAHSWSLRWRSCLANTTARPLALGHPHSREGLAGSHYTGLQFRGARALLDDHGDPAIRVTNSDHLDGEQSVHAAPASWMEWHAQSDTSLRRVTIRFENHGGPLHWFLRRHNPLAAFPFHFDRDRALAPGAALGLDHSLTFTSPP